MNLIIHISDLHFGSGREPKAAEKVVAAVRGLNVEPGVIALALTGDLAYSGKANEYSAAATYLSVLRDLMRKEFSTAVHIVACPGNHDCNFPEDTAVRDLVVEKIRSKSELPESEGMLAECTSVQKSFFEWLNNMGTGFSGSSRCLAWIIDVPSNDGTRIVFRVLNTAWMSTIREVQGGLFFPTSHLPEIDRADVRVTMLHHPYAWFQSGNARELRRTLEECSDLVLTGHEHDYDEYAVVRRSGNPTGYLEGGMFAGDKQIPETFNVIQIEPAERRYAVSQFSWLGDGFSVASVSPEWHPYVCTTGSAAQQRRLSKETQDFLEDPGLQLTHRAKSVTMEDIFVAPDLRDYDRSDKPGAMGAVIIPSRLTMNTLFEDRYAYLLGEGECGKTSLAKIMFIHAVRRGLTPTFLTGGVIRKPEPDSLRKQVEDAIRRQYDGMSPEKFWQLPKEDRVAFVDDFAETPLNAKGKGAVATWLKANFGRVFLFGGDLTQVEELVAVPEEQEGLSGFKRYEVRPFGHLLRDVLIEKWLTLGREHSIEATDVDHRIRRIADIINKTLGDSLFPPNPVYVLILLQQLEAEVPLDTRSGSYGYFYEAILTLALQRSSDSPEDLDAKYTYLSELAWHMHCQESPEIDEEDLDRFTTRHLDQFRLTKSGADLKKEVIDSRVLQVRYGKFRFVYRCFLYYFTARHMRDNIEDENVQSCIAESTREIHREDSANILVFLTYLTKSKPVIRQVLDRARTLFQGIEPCNLTEHVAFLGRIQESVPRIVLPDGDPKKQRRALLKNRDENEGQSNEPEEEMQEDHGKANEKAELDLLLSINRAIKALQVLGQILRNFSGSLRSELKLEITRECFDLALRVLNGFYGSLERHLDSTLIALADLFGKNLSELPERQRVEVAKKFLFFVTEVMCVATLRRISYAVGSETLVRTYEDLEENHSTRATRFVHLSLRLDHCQPFPEKRILDLLKEVKNDVFGETLLRILVAEHFYLFPRPYRMRQSICQKLRISYQRTLGKGRGQQKGGDSRGEQSQEGDAEEPPA